MGGARNPKTGSYGTITSGKILPHRGLGGEFVKKVFVFAPLDLSVKFALPATFHMEEKGEEDQIRGEQKGRGFSIRAHWQKGTARVIESFTPSQAMLVPEWVKQPQTLKASLQLWFHHLGGRSACGCTCLPCPN